MHQHQDGKRDQDSRRQAAQGRLGFHVPANTKSLPNDAGKLVQNLGQISAAVLLHNQRRNQKANIERWDSIGQMFQRVPQWNSVILLFKRDGEFSRDRLRGLLSHQLHGGGECMAGAHRAAQHVQGVREPLFKQIQPFVALEGHDGDGNQRRQDSRGKCDNKGGDSAQRLHTRSHP